MVALYLGVAVVATHPLARELGSVLPGVPGDGGVYLWCIDTFWTELGAGRSPFSTHRILVPVGANLLHANCPVLLSVFSYPFLHHLMLYADLAVLASLVGAAIAMMLLVRALTASVAAAVLGGLLYGFSPPLLSLLTRSQFPSVTAAALLPAGILCLVSFMRTARWGALVGLGATLWGLLLTNVYFAAAFLVMAVVMAIVLVPARCTARHLGRAVLFGAINILALLAIARWGPSPGDVRDLPHGGHAFTSRSVVNLVDFLVPSPANPALGSLNERWAFDGNNGDVPSYFLGWGILLLAAGATLRRWRDPEIIALAAAGVVIAVLACGTALHAGPTTLLEGPWTPYAWLARLPFFELFDSPRRLVVGASMVVAALAGVGIARLAAWSGRRRLVTVGVLLVAALEYGQVGMPVHAIPVPEVYQRLAAMPDDRTVLELGRGLAASNLSFGLEWSVPSGHVMYWQTIHRKPRVGGYLARVPWSTYSWFHKSPIINDIYVMTQMGTGEWPGNVYPPEAVQSFIDTFDLGYVIVPPHRRHQYWVEIMETLLEDRIARSEDLDGHRLYTLVDRGAGQRQAPPGPGAAEPTPPDAGPEGRP